MISLSFFYHSILTSNTLHVHTFHSVLPLPHGPSYLLPDISLQISTTSLSLKKSFALLGFYSFNGLRNDPHDHPIHDHFSPLQSTLGIQSSAVTKHKAKRDTASVEKPNAGNDRGAPMREYICWHVLADMQCMCLNF